jgi:hypothetical protein
MIKFGPCRMDTRFNAWLIGLLCCLFACLLIMAKRPRFYIVYISLFPLLVVSVVFQLISLSGHPHEYRVWVYIVIFTWVLYGYIGTFIGWFIGGIIENIRWIRTYEKKFRNLRRNLSIDTTSMLPVEKPESSPNHQTPAHQARQASQK